MSGVQLDEAPLPTTVQRHVLSAGVFRQHSRRVTFSGSPAEGSPPPAPRQRLPTCLPCLTTSSELSTKETFTTELPSRGGLASPVCPREPTPRPLPPGP
jgi:hypothetical protein